VINKKNHIPKLISIAGVDGSGKTTIANWLADELSKQGVKTGLVWSRFRNYLSKPLLALTRMTGDNYYQKHDDILFGYHDFERLVGYREFFALTQAIDVNIGAYWYINREKKKADTIICERSPWDTLVDVVSDTGLESLLTSRLGSLYTMMMRGDAKVFWVSRSYENILSMRPELVHDHKLSARISYYKQLAEHNDWITIDNDGSLDNTKEQLARQLWGATNP